VPPVFLAVPAAINGVISFLPATIAVPLALTTDINHTFFLIQNGFSSYLYYNSIFKIHIDPVTDSSFAFHRSGAGICTENMTRGGLRGNATGSFFEPVHCRPFTLTLKSWMCINVL
jgi:hypothetical protein